MTLVDRQRVLQADLEYVWHPMTQHAALAQRPPRIIVSAKGCTVVDGDGKEYLDAMAGLWCVNVGYGRREIADAVYQQLLKLPYFPHTQVNIPAALLAERVAELAGGDLKRTYFVNSGSEAVEAALKLARQYQRQVRRQSRHKFVSRYYSYHGTTLATLAAGGLPERKIPYEPLDSHFVRVAPPYCYRCPFGLSYPACELACAKQVDYVIKAEGPETVAAVIVEPIQSALGVLVPPDEYLREVAATCRRYGVLLIADEVINGFGRTGRWFAFQHYGVIPDLLVIAKGFTSSYMPMGAVVATEEVFSGFLGEVSENRHAAQISTWGGHAAAAVAALTNLEIMAREELPDRAANTGAYLLEGLRTLLDLPHVGDVRGKGLLIGIELVEDKSTRGPLAGHRLSAIVEDCMERGLIVGRSAGWGAGLGNTITLAPPLTLTREEAERIVGILAEVLSRV